MRIALLSSEVVAFAKTGGLADVSGALTQALREHSVDARVFLPLYEQIDRQLLAGDPIENVPIEWRGQIRTVRVWQSEATEVPAYLIEAPEFFARPSIYGFGDDHPPFAFFFRPSPHVPNLPPCHPTPP